MMEDSIPKRFIVVEGKTDLNIVLRLLEKNNPGMTWENRDDHRTFVINLPEEKELQLVIREEKGIDQLCGRISVWLKLPKLECIGFVFDADNNPRGRWQQVREKILMSHRDLQSIKGAKLKRIFGETPISEGMWIKGYKPEIGMWMMPNNEDTGTIEDFLAYMIHSEDRYWGHARNYVDVVLQETIQFPKRKTLKESKASKANIYAWLAVQENPGRLPATAIKTGYLNAKDPRVQPFQRWLKGL